MFTEELDIVANADIVMKEKEGRKFFDVQKVRVSFTIGKLKIQLSNLYNGLKALGKSCFPLYGNVFLLTAELR